MRRVVLGLVAAFAVAVPAQAAEDIPPIHCDPISCEELIERRIDYVVGQTQGVQDCVDGARRAIVYILQGTPQPQECSP